MTTEDSKEAEKAIDIFKHTPIRYLGYANEVGEAFRSIIGSRWVAVTYGIATCYVIADTAHKTKEASDIHFGDGRLKRISYKAADTLVWQMLASVIIPGFTINRICALSNYLLKKKGTLPKTRRTLYVTGIGLLAIPFIIKPIDILVDVILDETMRKHAP